MGHLEHHLIFDTIHYLWARLSMVRKIFRSPIVWASRLQASSDSVYYTLAIIGVALFFIAEHINPEEYENRKSVANAYRNQAFLTDFSARPKKYFGPKEWLDQAKIALLGLSSEYVEEQEERRDECAPSNFSKYDFCKNEKFAYEAAKKRVERGYMYPPVQHGVEDHLSRQADLFTRTRE